MFEEFIVSIKKDQKNKGVKHQKIIDEVYIQVYKLTGSMMTNFNVKQNLK